MNRKKNGHLNSNCPPQQLILYTYPYLRETQGKERIEVKQLQVSHRRALKYSRLLKKGYLLLLHLFQPLPGMLGDPAWCFPGGLSSHICLAQAQGLSGFLGGCWGVPVSLQRISSSAPWRARQPLTRRRRGGQGTALPSWTLWGRCWPGSLAVAVGKFNSLINALWALCKDSFTTWRSCGCSQKPFAHPLWHLLDIPTEP